jgi:hypothetical protein
METVIVSEKTIAGKVNTRHGSSDCLTALVPEREGLINPTSYMKWREAVIALELGLTSVEG